jgi:hypothetical protein
MTEGQIYVPSNAVVQTNPLNDQLLLIADMQYSGFTLPIGQTDATFAAFGRSNPSAAVPWHSRRPSLGR